MKEHDPKNMYNELLKAFGIKLKEQGFVGRGSVFRFFSSETCAIIDFQKSDKSNTDKIIFTINLGVVCIKLLEANFQTEKAQIVDAHLRQRIGMLLPSRNDKWWEINVVTEFQDVNLEIIELLTHKALPYLNSYNSCSALISLWESGQSPGLTEFQRNRFLEQLKNR